MAGGSLPAIFYCCIPRVEFAVGCTIPVEWTIGWIGLHARKRLGLLAAMALSMVLTLGWTDGSHVAGSFLSEGAWRFKG
jgi:hypothetical protein